MLKYWMHHKTFQMENLIYSYTRKQAIEDGVLFQCPETLRTEAGFNYPIAWTTSLEIIINNSVTKGGNVYEGVVWDLLTMLHLAAKQSQGESIIFFQVIIWSKFTRDNRTMKFKAICGPGDTMDPVLTVMLPNVD